MVLAPLTRFQNPNCRLARRRDGASSKRCRLRDFGSRDAVKSNDEISKTALASDCFSASATTAADAGVELLAAFARRATPEPGRTRPRAGTVAGVMRAVG